jgi:hypothetical protein
MYAAERLIVLRGRFSQDRDIQVRLRGLRRRLLDGVCDSMPCARDALKTIVMLDAPAWAALVALTDECPALHAAISPTRDRTRPISPYRLRVGLRAAPDRRGERVHGVAARQVDPINAIDEELPRVPRPDGRTGC